MGLCGFDVPLRLCGSKSWCNKNWMQLDASCSNFFKKVPTFCIRVDQNKSLVSTRIQVYADHCNATPACRQVMRRTCPSRIFDFFDLERYSASWICARKRLFKAIWAKFRKTLWNLPYDWFIVQLWVHDALWLVQSLIIGAYSSIIGHWTNYKCIMPL